MRLNLPRHLGENSILLKEFLQLTDESRFQNRRYLKVLLAYKSAKLELISRCPALATRRKIFTVTAIKYYNLVNHMLNFKNDIVTSDHR